MPKGDFFDRTGLQVFMRTNSLTEAIEVVSLVNLINEELEDC